MKIQIRPRGIKLSQAQRDRLEQRLGLVLARFGERIDRVVVRLSDAAAHPGYTRCELEVMISPQHVRVDHSDTTIFLAVDHALGRAARSVSRAIEKESWPPRR